MDRISTLRNIEESLARFEDGEIPLPTLEREVRGILRTYATSFDDEAATYRIHGEDRVEGLVVVATSPQGAREQVADLIEDPGPIDVERVE
jgi:hypothetical protein